MHILKDSTTGLLFSPFAVGGVWHLQIAVLVYFALNDPDSPLPEQDLWPQCLESLGEGGILDPGFPKPRGEVLLAGSWYAPDGTPAPGGAARFQVGPVRRELAIFGPRFWQAGPLGTAPSQPEPVSTVPLRWESAFGGDGFADNPAGRGMLRAEMPWGESRLPLPLVEDPQYGLMTSPAARPAPACPLPIPGDAPSRLALAGTYDARWLAEDWPGFPADISRDFFSLAAPCQRLAPDYGDASADDGFSRGYFQGGEAIRLEHLHPRQPLLAGRLPRKRVRIFATRRNEPCPPGRTEFRTPSGQDARPAEGRFEECRTRLDTVWLFPERERGLVIYRAVLPTADDEYSDIVRLFPVVEAEDAPRTDIAYWQAEQERRLARAVPAEPDFPPEASAMLERARSAVRTLEEDVNLTFDRTAGKAPTPPPDARKQLAQARAQVARSLDMLDRAEGRLGALHKEFGHVAKIDVHALESLRRDTLSLLPALDRAENDARQMDRLVAVARKREAALWKQAEHRLAHLPTPEMQAAVDNAGLTLAEPEPSAAGRWSEAALRLLGKHLLVEDDGETAREIMAQLQAIGLRHTDMQHALLGLLPEPLDVDVADWGLDPAAIPPEMLCDGRRIRLPAGLLVPFFEDSACIALSVRPIGRTDDGRPDVPACFLPCTVWHMPGGHPGGQLLGSIRPKPLLVTCDPLAGWLLYAHAGDLCAILIVTAPDAPLPESAQPALREAAAQLCPVPPLPAEAAPGSTPPDMPQGCAPLPWPAQWAAPHLAAARIAGLPVRDWLRDELAARSLPLPPENGGLSREKDDKGRVRLHVAAPKVDVAGIIGRLRQRAATHVETARAAHERAMQKGLTSINEGMARLGHPPVQAPHATLAEILSRPFPTDPHPDVLDNLAKLEKRLQDMHRPRDVVKVQKLRERYLEGLLRIKHLDEEARSRIAALEKRFASGSLLPDMLPDWVRNIPGAEALLRPAPPDPAGIVEKLRQGATGLTLKNMDFSGQNLAGCAFVDCFLEDVDFSGADLRDTRWEKVMGTRLNLQGADLSGATLRLCNFTETDWPAVHAENLRAELCQWRDGCWQDADLRGAHLKLSGFTGVVWRGRLEGAQLELLTHSGGSLEELTLHDCNLRKCTFLEDEIRSLRVEGGRWQETGFVTCTGGGIQMTDCDAENLRFLVRCELSDVVFRHCRLDGLCCREVSLPGLRLAGCTLAGACLDRCDLPRAVLAGCRAPGAHIRHCNLEEADMRRFSLPGGSLRRSRLVRANLREANLYGADLYKAVLGETGLQDVNLSRTLLHGADELLRRMEMSR